MAKLILRSRQDGENQIYKVNTFDDRPLTGLRPNDEMILTTGSFQDWRFKWDGSSWNTISGIVPTWAERPGGPSSLAPTGAEFNNDSKIKIIEFPRAEFQWSESREGWGAIPGTFSLSDTHLGVAVEYMLWDPRTVGASSSTQLSGIAPYGFTPGMMLGTHNIDFDNGVMHVERGNQTQSVNSEILSDLTGVERITHIVVSRMDDISGLTTFGGLMVGSPSVYFTNLSAATDGEMAISWFGRRVSSESVKGATMAGSGSVPADGTWRSIRCEVNFNSSEDNVITHLDETFLDIGTVVFDSSGVTVGNRSFKLGYFSTARALLPMRYSVMIYHNTDLSAEDIALIEAVTDPIKNLQYDP
jgi:hypothetical protein